MLSYISSWGSSLFTGARRASGQTSLEAAGTLPQLSKHDTFQEPPSQSTVPLLPDSTESPLSATRDEATDPDISVLGPNLRDVTGHCIKPDNKPQVATTNAEAPILAVTGETSPRQAEVLYEKTFFCLRCRIYLPGQQELDLHLEQDRADRIPVKGSSLCQYCRLYFDDKKALREHVSTSSVHRSACLFDQTQVLDCRTEHRDEKNELDDMGKWTLETVIQEKPETEEGGSLYCTLCRRCFTTSDVQAFCRAHFVGGHAESGEVDREKWEQELIGKDRWEIIYCKICEQRFNTLDPEAFCKAHFLERHPYEAWVIRSVLSTSANSEGDFRRNFKRKLAEAFYVYVGKSKKAKYVFEPVFHDTPVNPNPGSPVKAESHPVLPAEQQPIDLSLDLSSAAKEVIGSQASREILGYDATLSESSEVIAANGGNGSKETSHGEDSKEENNDEPDGRDDQLVAKKIFLGSAEQNSSNTKDSSAIKAEERQMISVQQPSNSAQGVKSSTNGVIGPDTRSGTFVPIVLNGPRSQPSYLADCPLCQWEFVTVDPGLSLKVHLYSVHRIQELPASTSSGISIAATTTTSATNSTVATSTTAATPTTSVPPVILLSGDPSGLGAKYRRDCNRYSADIYSANRSHQPHNLALHQPVNVPQVLLAPRSLGQGSLISHAPISGHDPTQAWAQPGVLIRAPALHGQSKTSDGTSERKKGISGSESESSAVTKISSLGRQVNEIATAIKLRASAPVFTPAAEKLTASIDLGGGETELNGRIDLELRQDGPDDAIGINPFTRKSEPKAASNMRPEEKQEIELFRFASPSLLAKAAPDTRCAKVFKDHNLKTGKQPAVITNTAHEGYGIKLTGPAQTEPIEETGVLISELTIGEDIVPVVGSPGSRAIPRLPGWLWELAGATDAAEDILTTLQS